MTEHSALERRYRRMMRFYPASFRAEHEEELITVLMHGADPGQQHPRGGESIDLARNGLRARLRRLGERIPGEWERKHAKAMFPIRIGIAIWLCVLTALLLGYHQSPIWLVLFLPAIAAHIYLAYRIRPGGRRPSV